jgi:hypothetical protein
MGPHAGEQSDCIFRRKIDDISCVGWTLWLIRSYKAKPDSVQALCRESNPICVIFVEGSTKGAARPTKGDARATQYSADQQTWSSLPSAMRPVTGHLSGHAYALALDQLEVYNHSIQVDLWDYHEYDKTYSMPQKPLETKQGCSTVCVVRNGGNEKTPGMKSRYRRVLACGQLRSPFAVWVK